MEFKFDLDWNDKEIREGLYYADTAFLFARMTNGTRTMVAPQKGERILDVGCGKAIDARLLACHGCNVAALDPSATMLREAITGLAASNDAITLIRGIGEALPFKRASLDKVVCKGALDHFPDPQKSLGEMAEVLKPGGKAIIAVANYESLACRIGRSWHWLMKKMVKGNHPRTPWELPPDHTYKFDYPILISLVEHHFRIIEVLPVSLLWTAPYWCKIISAPPKKVSNAILSFLDIIARRIPSLSDVIIVKCVPKHC